MRARSAWAWLATSSMRSAAPATASRLQCERFAESPPDFALHCGSSWEVDLRSDVDCNQPGLERCHPRYTLGWQHREVQLYREGLALPKSGHDSSVPEYVHAYCDVWRRGRVEQVLATPVERSEVRERASRHASRFPLAIDSGEGMLNVLVLVVRGLNLNQSRERLPRTIRAMARLGRSGRFQSAVYRDFVSASTSGEAALQTLIYGTAQRPLPQWAASRSLWTRYARSGYVTAFAEASCVSGASRAAGYSLIGEAPVDHALVEPACALDFQLAEIGQRPAAPQWTRPSDHSRAARAANGRRPATTDSDGEGDGEGGGGGDGVGNGDDFGCTHLGARQLREVAVAASLAEYSRAFLHPRLYPGLPKLAIAVFPAIPPDEATRRQLDHHLATLITDTLTAAPHTVLVLTSDVPPPPGYERSPPRRWAVPTLRILFPAGGAQLAAAGTPPALPALAWPAHVRLHKPMRMLVHMAGDAQERCWRPMPPRRHLPMTYMRPSPSCHGSG